MADEMTAGGDGSPQSGKRPRGPRSQRGQRAAVIAMGAVVLLLAVTVVGMSRASQPLGASATSTPTVRLPPAKATLFAREAETMSAARTANPNPSKPTYDPPTDAPTPTFTSGIFPALQDKFPSFYGDNAFKGRINGVWEIVRPGTEWPAPVPDYSAPGGYGAVRVYNAISDQLIGDFRAPDGSTWLVITAVNGDVLRLKSDRTASFGFDMTTNTFTS